MLKSNNFRTFESKFHKQTLIVQYTKIKFFYDIYFIIDEHNEEKRYFNKKLFRIKDLYIFDRLLQNKIILRKLNKKKINSENLLFISIRFN